MTKRENELTPDERVDVVAFFNNVRDCIYGSKYETASERLERVKTYFAGTSYESDRGNLSALIDAGSRLVKESNPTAFKSLEESVVDYIKASDTTVESYSQECYEYYALKECEDRLAALEESFGM